MSTETQEMMESLKSELGALQAELFQREDQLGRFLKRAEQAEAQRNELRSALQAVLDLEGEAVEHNRYGTGDLERKVFGQARAAIAKATSPKAIDPSGGYDTNPNRE